MVSTSQHPSILGGFMLAIIGSACYGLNPLFALPLYEMGVNPLNVLFYRYAISLILIAGYMLIQNECFKLTRKELLLSMVMGVMFAGSSACLFFSFKFVNAGLASVILFTYPLFVALLSWLVFHEKLKPITLLCIVIAFIGIWLLNSGQDSSSSQNVSNIGMLLAIGAGFSYAIYLIGVNRSVLKDMSTARISFYVPIGRNTFILCL